MKPTDIAKRIYRNLYWFPRHLWTYVGYRWPKFLIYWGGTGFGDDLLLSSVLHEARTRGRSRIAVITRLTELFLHSPDVDTVIPNDWNALEAAIRFRQFNHKPGYYLRFIEPETDVPAAHHIITEMCRSSGLRGGTVALRTYLYLTDEEKRKGKIVDNQAVIQCTSPDSVNFSPNKHWFPERYQAIVDAYRGKINFIQLGGPREPLLQGVLDLRGKTTPRESAAILANSRVCVSYVGFLMHLARAVDCRSVVIFGGRERPDQSGYVCNENLFSPVACAPCWRRRTCDWGRPCMTEITVEMALRAVDTVLEKDGTTLELEHQTIPAEAQEFTLPPYSDPRGKGLLA